MTLKELEYWGTPPYTTTLEDEQGHPIGIVYSDGTITMVDPSKDSRVGQKRNTQWLTCEVVWDGAMDDPNGGRSKGRLLPVKGPSYVDSLTRMRALARNVKDDDDGEDETAPGAVGDVPRKKKSNRQKRQQTVEGNGQTTQV